MTELSIFEERLAAVQRIEAGERALIKLGCLADVPGLNLSDREVFFNARVRRYPDGSATLEVCDRNIFRARGVEERCGGRRFAPHELPIDRAEMSYMDIEREGKVYTEYGEYSPAQIANINRAVRRARARLRVIARANPFTYFVTLTFDAARVNRYDERAVVKKCVTFCNNAAQRYGLKYALVPERHKDGAVHFHGFFSDALPLTDSGTIVPPGGGKPRRPRSAAQREAWLAGGGRVVLNIPGWTWGFSTAIRLYGEYTAAVAYVCKYIGKQTAVDGAALPTKIGGRWYYSGGGLREPEVELAHLDYDEIAQAYPGYAFTVTETGDRYHVTEFRNSPSGEVCRAGGE